MRLNILFGPQQIYLIQVWLLTNIIIFFGSQLIYEKLFWSATNLRTIFLVLLEEFW